MAASMSWIEVSFSARKVRSTTEPVGVGTRKLMPVSFPLVTGSTSPTAFAAPVVEGMMLIAAARPPLQSFWETPSTVFCVAVYEWIVVIRPVSIPKPSLRITWTTGARQFVVQLALDRTWCFAGSYSSLLTPMTKVLTGLDSSFDLPGAEIITFFAPASMWP